MDITMEAVGKAAAADAVALVFITGALLTGGAALPAESAAAGAFATGLGFAEACSSAAGYVGATAAVGRMANGDPEYSTGAFVADIGLFAAGGGLARAQLKTGGWMVKELGVSGAAGNLGSHLLIAPASVAVEAAGIE